MNSNLPQTFLVSCVLALAQLLAALPWLCALNPERASREWRRPTSWLWFAAAVVGLGVALTGIILFRSDPDKLEFDGRLFGSILHLQLVIDVVIFIVALMIGFWPKGGTVAFAAFREGYRQPMFWLIGGLVVIMLIVSMVIPYFTLGEDFKMMKQLSFDMIKLSTVLFVVLAASMSVSEEIEGRTAVTLMSKPVTRRQFLLGKYAGILLAALLLTLLLGWFQNWALYIKPRFDRLEDSWDPLSMEVQRIVAPHFENLATLTEPKGFLKGVGLWCGETLANLCALGLGFGQVMVMLAIAAALATRLSMVVTVVFCLLFYLLGNLAPILATESKKLSERADASSALGIVNFLAQLLDKLFPSLSFFSTDQVFLRDTHLDPGLFAVYTLSVLGYAALYSAIALLVGLFLIEDRDLA